MRFIGISGSRELKNPQLVYDRLDCLYNKYIYITVISGEARGADRYAKKWALAHKHTGRVNYIGYPAEWRIDGVFDPQAGFKRNQMIVDRCDELSAFIVKTLPCNGTRDTIKKAEQAGKCVTIIEE